MFWETPIGKPQSGAAKSFRKLRDLIDLNSPNRLQTAFWLKINEYIMQRKQRTKGWQILKNDGFLGQQFSLQVVPEEDAAWI